MDFKLKINKYLSFTKEEPVLLAAAITFSYLLVFKAEQSDILEYVLFSIVMGYSFFLQAKNIFKKNLKDQILNAKINFVYNTYIKDEIESDEYELTRMEIIKLEEKLSLLK